MKRQFYMMGLVTVALLICALFLSPGLLAPKHLLEIVRQATPLAIATLGQSVVMLTGGADLSIGSVITFTNIFAADLMARSNSPVVEAGVIVLLLCAGFAIGSVNGSLIHFTKMPPFVMTLGMSSIVTGAYLIYSKGAPKGRVSEFLRFVGSGRLGILPASVIVLVLVNIMMYFLIHKSTFGYKVYYVGSNPTASIFSGVKTSRIIIQSYGLSSMLAVVSGLILSGYIGIGSFKVGGDPYVLNTMAAAVIGGTTFDGGTGNMVGPVFGAVIFTFLSALLVTLGLGEPFKYIVKGLIIIAMVLSYSKRS